MENMYDPRWRGERERERERERLAHGKKKVQFSPLEWFHDSSSKASFLKDLIHPIKQVSNICIVNLVL